MKNISVFTLDQSLKHVFWEKAGWRNLFTTYYNLDKKEGAKYIFAHIFTQTHAYILVLKM